MEAINAIADFEIHSSILDELVDVILVDEILRYVGEFDIDILGIFRRRC